MVWFEASHLRWGKYMLLFIAYVLVALVPSIHCASPQVLEATIQVHEVEVTSTVKPKRASFLFSDEENAVPKQKSHSFYYQVGVIEVWFDQPLFLDSASLLDVEYFLSLQRHHRQVMYGLATLNCPNGHSVHSFPTFDPRPGITKPISFDELDAARQKLNSRLNNKTGDPSIDLDLDIDSYFGEGGDDESNSESEYGSGAGDWSELINFASDPYTYIRTLAQEAVDDVESNHAQTIAQSHMLYPLGSASTSEFAWLRSLQKDHAYQAQHSQYLSSNHISFALPLTASYSSVNTHSDYQQGSDIIFLDPETLPLCELQIHGNDTEVPSSKSDKLPSASSSTSSAPMDVTSSSAGNGVSIKINEESNTGGINKETSDSTKLASDSDYRRWRWRMVHKPRLLANAAGEPVELTTDLKWSTRTSPQSFQVVNEYDQEQSFLQESEYTSAGLEGRAQVPGADMIMAPMVDYFAGFTIKRLQDYITPSLTTMASGALIKKLMGKAAAGARGCADKFPMKSLGKVMDMVFNAAARQGSAYADSKGSAASQEELAADAEAQRNSLLEIRSKSIRYKQSPSSKEFQDAAALLELSESARRIPTGRPVPYHSSNHYKEAAVKANKLRTLSNKLVSQTSRLWPVGAGSAIEPTLLQKTSTHSATATSARLSGASTSALESGLAREAADATELLNREDNVMQRLEHEIADHGGRLPPSMARTDKTAHRSHLPDFGVVSVPYRDSDPAMIQQWRQEEQANKAEFDRQMQYIRTVKEQIDHRKAVNEQFANDLALDHELREIDAELGRDTTEKIYNILEQQGLADEGDKSQALDEWNEAFGDEAFVMGDNGDSLLQQQSTTDSVGSETGDMKAPCPLGVMGCKVVKLGVQALTMSTFPAIHAVLKPMLVEGLSSAVYLDLEEEVPRELKWRIGQGTSDSLSAILGFTVPPAVDRAIITPLAMMTVKVLAHTLTRGITHTIAPALGHTLRDASRQDPVCYYCLFVDKSYCHLCKKPSYRDGYYQLYLVDFFVDYYSDYYSQIMIGSLGPVDTGTEGEAVAEKEKKNINIDVDTDEAFDTPLNWANIY